MELTVVYNHTSLIGPASLSLPASQEPVRFEFFYAPLALGSAASSVVLVNDEVGEFRYQVRASKQRCVPSRHGRGGGCRTGRGGWRTR